MNRHRLAPDALRRKWPGGIPRSNAMRYRRIMPYLSQPEIAHFSARRFIRAIASDLLGWLARELHTLSSPQQFRQQFDAVRARGRIAVPSAP